MKPTGFGNLSLHDILSGKVELPEGFTKGLLLGAITQIDLHQVLTHSCVELAKQKNWIEFSPLGAPFSWTAFMDAPANPSTRGLN